MMVAKFLQQTRGLNMALVGDYLSNRAPFNAQVRAFIATLSPPPLLFLWMHVGA